MKHLNLVIYMLGIFVFFGGLIVLICLASIPYNPISLDFDKRNLIFVLAPQGWGFFTKDPRELQTFIYKRVDGKWELIDKPSGDPSFYFGASRKSRKIIYEKDVILAKFSEVSAWTDNKDLSLTQLAKHLPQHTYQNPVKNHIVSGNILIVKKEPVPWAWSSSYYNIHMPYKCISLKIIN